VALGAEARYRSPRFRLLDLVLAARRPGPAIIVALLLVLLVPLFAVLVVMIFYLTAMVTTLALAGGLALAYLLFAA
jgi:hypothetical protein